MTKKKKTTKSIVKKIDENQDIDGYENGAINIRLEKRGQSVPTKDKFRNSLVVFKEGVQNLENGARLLNKILKPTRVEMVISLISLNLSEKMRFNRILNLDLEATQKRLMKKAKETLEALANIIDLLDVRYKTSSEESLRATTNLEKNLTYMEKLKKEEESLNEEVKTVSSTIDTDADDEKQGRTREIKEVENAKKLIQLKKKLQDNSLEREKLKAQIKTAKSLSKTEGAHAEYSYNMLKRLLPIQELITVNKEILHNRIEMLNRLAAAGAILKPLGELSEELGNVSLQFAEANSMLNNITEEISLTY